MVFWHRSVRKGWSHGLYRDETTHEPHEYYCKPPTPIELRTIVVTDPMLANPAVPAVEVIDLYQHAAERTSNLSGNHRAPKD